MLVASVIGKACVKFSRTVVILKLFKSKFPLFILINFLLAAAQLFSKGLSIIPPLLQAAPV